ncbi:MAG: MarR family winged helix-turn-helix transcriptional regulator [Gammaproteobacteria bacterium]|nr:MarR family winged helix-turn-helix transcriptional regulator [Gammaproteobacteria bacterium]MDH5693769.1 MarR family winged helix-turn-helix transcriptional regulator [Gammaproteobacteria bacterium]
MSNPLEESLGFNLTRVATLFRRELLAALAEFEMTPEQWQIMVSLWTQNEPLTQKDIVNITLKDKHSISRIISRLENNGWVTKSQASSDSRSTIIHQTEKGRELKSLAPPILIKHFSTITGQLTEKEHDQLLALLKKLRKILGDNNV